MPESDWYATAMPRTARVAPGGMLFHVLNRGVGKMRLFLKHADFEAFDRIVEKTLETAPMRICAYCLLPNHWFFVLWPQRDGELGAFMQKLTITHVRNWQENRRRVGVGGRTANASGIAVAAPQRCPRSAVRRRRLDAKDGQTSRPRIDPALPRPPEKETALKALSPKYWTCPVYVRLCAEACADRQMRSESSD